MSCGVPSVEGVCRWRIKCHGGWYRDCNCYSRRKLEHSFKLGFRASNNEAKYEALLVGLKTVLGMGAQDVEAYSYSQLVVNQVRGSFEAHDSRMKEYLRVVMQVMGKFCTAKVV